MKNIYVSTLRQLCILCKYILIKSAASLILSFDLFYFLEFFFLKDFLSFQRKGKEGRKAGFPKPPYQECASACQKYQSVALSHPQLGAWPATQACALTWNQTGDLSVLGLALSPLSHQLSLNHCYSEVTKAKIGRNLFSCVF